MGSQESRTTDLKQRSQSDLGLGSSYARQKDIGFLYVMGRVLNSGKCGTVRLGHLKGDPSMSVAIKTLDKTNAGNTLERLKREINNLMDADHPNILKLYDVYEDSQYVHLVTEYCSGGELFDRIHTKGRFDEAEAASVMKMILSAVKYLHERNVIHRDLKPENFMYLSPEEGAPLKLIDFGFSRKLSSPEAQPLTMLGTPSYISPELLTGTYGPETDLWSCGVILYTMLAGRYPFYDIDEKKIIQQVKRGEFSMVGSLWTQVSADAKDLIRKLLEKNPSQRLTAVQALQHQWFARSQGQVITLDEELVDAFRSYQVSSKLQRNAMLFIVNHFPLKDIRGLLEVFQDSDGEMTNSVYPEEMKRLLGTRVREDLQQELNAVFDFPMGAFDGTINYVHFFFAAKECKLRLLEQTLWETFKAYCPSEQGNISMEQADRAMFAIGILDSPETLRKEMDPADSRTEFTYEEFKLLLRKLA